MTTKQNFCYKQSCNYKLLKKKNISGQLHRERLYYSDTNWVLGRRSGAPGGGGGERIMLLNSETPSREQSSLASVAQNFDSSFHLVSIRRGNLANGWPRNCSTCTSWPWAPVKGAKENEEISPGPSVQSSAGKVALERNREFFHLAGQVHTKLTVWLHSKVPKPSVMGHQLF